MIKKRRIDITEKIFLEESSQSGNTIVSFNGNIGPDNLPQIESYFKKHVMSEPGLAVILDLSSIRYLSSLVLGFFLKLYKELIKYNREMRIAVPSKSLQELFIMTNINSVISIHDSLAHALKHDENDSQIPAFDNSSTEKGGLNLSDQPAGQPVHPSDKEREVGPKPFLCELKMEITSASFFVKIVRESLRITVTENYEITPEEEMDLLLCLGEAVNNAIKHGYHDHGMQGKVQIWILFFADRIVVAVEDFGAGFDEEEILAKAVQAPEKFTSTSGRGIFIINSLMDHAIHRSDAKSSSTSIFIKFLKVKSDSELCKISQN